MEEKTNSMCKKHVGLVVGGGVCHITGVNTCDECGADVALDYTAGEYDGHVIKGGRDAAHFSIKDDVTCACGRKIVGLFDMCEQA